MLAVLGMESGFETDECRRHQRAGHSRRPPGAAAQGEPQARQFHRRGHEPRRRRSRGACRSRHRPLRRPADDRGRRRAARLPRTALCRRDKAVPAGREHRTAVALRLRRRQCRARPAGRRRLAGAQGQTEEPHPRDRGRADQDRGRAAAARGAENAGAAACLRRVLRALPLRGDRGPARRDRRDAEGPRKRPADGPADLRRRRLRQDRGGAARRLCRRARRQAGRGRGADHAARAPAQQDLRRALPRLSGQGRAGLAPGPGQGADAGQEGACRRQGRHRGRHPRAARQGDQVQGPRPADRRRGAAFRRQPQGAAEAAARRGARADADARRRSRARCSWR